MRRRLASATLLAVVALGCVDLAGPLPRHATWYKPPAVYALWWAQVKACSGREGYLEALDFYEVPGDEIPLGLEMVGGMYQGSDHRIIVASDFLLNGPLVRHEMLHALASEHGHSRELFLHRCGDVVSCGGTCLEEAGRAPARPTVARVSPAEMEVAIAVEPGEPSSTRYDGHLVLVVTSRNPYAHPVVVEVPPSGDAGPPIGFSFRVESGPVGSWYNGRIHDMGTTFFRAGETKRAVFDFRIGRAGGDWSLAPGDYTAQGSFSTNTGAPAAFRISP